MHHHEIPVLRCVPSIKYGVFECSTWVKCRTVYSYSCQVSVERHCCPPLVISVPQHCLPGNNIALSVTVCLCQSVIE